MATPFSRTLNAIKSEQDDLAVQLFMYLCTILVLGIVIYGVFFTDMPIETENYTLLPTTHLADTRTSGPPAAVRKITATFPRSEAATLKAGEPGCLEITDPANMNTRQICGRITAVTADDQQAHLQLDLPLEHEHALDLPHTSKGKIIVHPPGVSLFATSLEKLGIRKSFRSVSFYPTGRPSDK